ncbi:Hypothetical predicted protein [Podarcis lilfordi]|uniref:Uncharacterized protein n=1 Tax=Podarcis lilfordi TaxID=74358 RepID=A0AA35NU48_9SAUR|nr:Hypothetical predicted protein [Podarcis lilfordi]
MHTTPPGCRNRRGRKEHQGVELGKVQACDSEAAAAALADITSLQLARSGSRQPEVNSAPLSFARSALSHRSLARLPWAFLGGRSSLPAPNLPLFLPRGGLLVALSPPLPGLPARLELLLLTRIRQLQSTPNFGNLGLANLDTHEQTATACGSTKGLLHFVRIL